MVIFERWYILINSEKIAYLLWARQYAKYQEHAFMKKLQCIKKKKKKNNNYAESLQGLLENGICNYIFRMVMLHCWLKFIFSVKSFCKVLQSALSEVVSFL